MLINAREIAKTYALRTLFSGIDLAIREDDRLGLIGPNGAGKSTFLKILAGQIRPDAGTTTAAKSMRAVYVPQEDAFEGTVTPREAVLASAMAHIAAPEAIHDEHEAEIVADQVLDRLGFRAEHIDKQAGTLSGGWRKRLSLAIALASCGGEPDLILLDEPTNHLDLDGVRWLETLLKRGEFGRTPFASVFVTHDRAFLESVATRIAELSQAYPQGLLCIEGNYSEFLRRKQEFLDGQSKAQQVMANQVRKDLAWLSRGPQGRGTKAKGRIQASHARIDELSEIKTRNTAAASGGARVDFQGTDRRTKKLIAAKEISKSLGGRLLFPNLDLALGVGDCVGLLGPNGSGKTTLIKVLTGELKPDTGTVVQCDPRPRVAVFSQHRQDFPPTTTLKDALCPVSDQVRYRDRPMHVTAWARRFLFRDEQLAQPLSSLSGGELARVHIARIMLETADVLVLDEPTNDLDIPTLEIMEEALEDFPGAIILVTHDRAMLGRLTTEIVSLGGGRATKFVSLEQALAAKPAGDDANGAKGSAKPAAASGPAGPKKKLSYNDQREYDGMEENIRRAEIAVTKAEQAVDRATNAGDRVKIASACAALEEAQRKVAQLYERWEELEAKIKP